MLILNAGARLNPREPLPNQVPAPVVALMIVRVLERMTREDEPTAHRLLSGLWEGVRDALKPIATEEPETLATVCALVLDEYFRHEGHWPRMRECLRHSLRLEGVPDRIIDMLEQGGDELTRGFLAALMQKKQESHR